MYRVLTEEQLLQLCLGKWDKVQNLLSFLTRQGRIFHDGEYYSSGDFPAKVIYFVDGEVYEIIHHGQRLLSKVAVGTPGGAAIYYRFITEIPKKQGSNFGHFRVSISGPAHTGLKALQTQGFSGLPFQKKRPGYGPPGRKNRRMEVISRWSSTPCPGCS